jgi:hypothetical protein
MVKAFTLLCISIFCCQILFSQQALKGRVLSSDTKNPIPLANVFLSNTAVGVLSDENGAFVIQNFPAGRYELVISCIGYETFILTIQSDHLPENLQVKLKPKVEVLDEVVVEPYEKNGWEKYGTSFIESFIGRSAFAHDCKLLNKETVKFRFSKKHNTLQAFADEPLVIENKALGFIVKYTLTKFEINHTTLITFYQGYPLFQEMQDKRSRIRKRWINNRQEAYYGSLMHFMRSLYRNKLQEEHFEVRKLIPLSDAEKQRVKKIYQDQVKKLSFESRTITLEPNMGFKNADSANYYNKVMNRPKELDVLIDTLLPGDSIAYAVNKTTLALDFTDHLQVVYTLKKPPYEYALHFLTPSETFRPVSSELVLLSDKPIMILANGSFFEGANLLTSGYFGWWEKLGDMLPFGYWPPPKK